VERLDPMPIISSCDLPDLIKAAKTLLQGNLVAFPTETVYGLGADATNSEAVAKIYKVKKRPTQHPLIVHISSVAKINIWANKISDSALELASAFWPGPLTLILPRQSVAKNDITGGQDYVAVRVPNNQIALTLLHEFENRGGIGIVAPSANRFGKISPTSANDVLEELSIYLNSEDRVLDGGESIIGVESTIIDCTGKTPKILRPGAITPIEIKHRLNMNIEIKTEGSRNKINAPGLLKSHYAPNAEIYLSGTPSLGDGFIALEKFATPKGAIRLAKPSNNIEYAQVLFKALRLADFKQIKKIFIVVPDGNDIALAVRDRVTKASNPRID
jgi:L-threonylcarbamoyladenylate synthase